MTGPDESRIRQELRDLVCRYASHVDRLRLDEVADLFTEDGELLIHEPGDREPRRAYRGRAEIRRVMEGLRRFSVTSHLVANQLLDIGPAGVTAETYCVASHIYDAGGGRRAYVMSIRYEDAFAHRDGRWRFAVRREWVDWAEDRPFTPPAA